MQRVKLEDAIEAAGLKKKFVAAKLGVSEPYLKQYLSNAGSINVKNALILSELTGLKLDELDFGQR